MICLNCYFIKIVLVAIYEEYIYTSKYEQDFRAMLAKYLRREMVIVQSRGGRDRNPIYRSERYLKVIIIETR